MAILYQMLSPENVNIEVTLYRLSRLYFFIFREMHTRRRKREKKTIKENEIMNLKKKKDGRWEGLQGKMI